MFSQHATSGQRGQSEGRQRSPLGRRLLLLLTLFTLSLGVSAQEAPATAVPETGTRPELLEQLQQVDSQLQKATAAGDQENIDRLIELKAQFEVLLLQAELEALRSENASLREQTSASETSSATALETPEAGETGSIMSGMEQEFTELDKEQANVLEQLNKIADQHAILFEELGAAEPETAEVVAEEPASQLEQELLALQSRFETLVDQQGIVNAELETISGQHADLLTTLSAPAPIESASTYIVKEGDSLSTLSQQAYGSIAGWEDIYNANPFLTDPNVIYVGTALTIP